MDTFLLPVVLSMFVIGHINLRAHSHESGGRVGNAELTGADNHLCVTALPKLRVSIQKISQLSVLLNIYETLGKGSQIL